MVQKDKDNVQILKALADETRMEIINMLLGGELCACKILENFKITQPTLSYHMKILTDCGFVEATRNGAWMKYSLQKARFAEVRDFLNDFYITIEQNQDKKADCEKECQGKENFDI